MTLVLNTRAVIVANKQLGQSHVALVFTRRLRSTNSDRFYLTEDTLSSSSQHRSTLSPLFRRNDKFRNQTDVSHSVLEEEETAVC